MVNMLLKASDNLLYLLKNLGILYSDLRRSVGPNRSPYREVGEETRGPFMEGEESLSSSCVMSLRADTQGDRERRGTSSIDCP